MGRKNRNTPPPLNRKLLIVKSLGITILAFILSLCLQAPFSASTSSIFSSPETTDFTLSDLFAQIANGRPVRRLEDRILIVDIGIGGREEIASVLDILSLCGPKTVGIDILFEEPTDDDSHLLTAIENTPGCILPVGVKPQGEKFVIEDCPFFYNEIKNVNYGAINFPTASAKSCIREYCTYFPSIKGNIPSFVTALAANYDPMAVADAIARNNNEETTAYHSKEFRIYSYDEVEKYCEDFTDKIVLIGSLSDAGDLHPTPINSSMPGIIIHASALSTLLDREWYTNLPKYSDYILAITICFLIVLATLGIKGGIRGLIIRLVQIGLAYCAVRVGYYLFVDKHIICNFSNTLIMIAFGLFAVDMWQGCEALIVYLKNKYKEKK